MTIKEYIDPVHKWSKQCLNVPPIILNIFAEKTSFFLFREKPKLGIDFPTDMVLADIHSRMMDYATHLQTTTITFLHKVLEKFIKGNPKLICYPVSIQLMFYKYQTAMKRRCLEISLKNWIRLSITRATCSQLPGTNTLGKHYLRFVFPCKNMTKPTKSIVD